MCGLVSAVTATLILTGAALAADDTSSAFEVESNLKAAVAKIDFTPPACQGLCDFFRRGLERPKHGRLFRDVIHAAGESANGSLLDKTMKNNSVGFVTVMKLVPP
jgi:hypothetical protein